jgi:hypothetical protein
MSEKYGPHTRGRILDVVDFSTRLCLAAGAGYYLDMGEQSVQWLLPPKNGSVAVECTARINSQPVLDATDRSRGSHFFDMVTTADLTVNRGTVDETGLYFLDDNRAPTFDAEPHAWSIYAQLVDSVIAHTPDLQYRAVQLAAQRRAAALEAGALSLPALRAATSGAVLIP